MFLLTVIILIVLYITYKKIGLNIGSIVGCIIGLFIGASLGVAGGGTAVAGTSIFGAVGFVIGGLLCDKSNK